MNEFFEILQTELDNAEETIIIIMGDMNGRVENNVNGIERYLGPHRKKYKNDSGVILLDLCEASYLVITNSKIKHKNIHNFTRKVPSRKEKSIIDYFLNIRENFKYVKDVRLCRDSEIGSDHYLLTMQINLGTTTTKVEKSKK